MFNRVLGSLKQEQGPGIWLQSRLAANSQPVKKLDSACLTHDLAYHNHKDLKNRHAADRALVRDDKEMEKIASGLHLKPHPRRGRGLKGEKRMPEAASLATTRLLVSFTKLG